ncbi:hypothetical protein [Nocardioides zeae]
MTTTPTPARGPDVRRSAWRVQISEDGASVSLTPRQPPGAPAKPFGEWARSPHGDVTDRRAFDAHMEQVGEEDQSPPDGTDGA